MKCARCKMQLKRDLRDGERVDACEKCQCFLIRVTRLKRIRARGLRSPEQLMEDWREHAEIDVTPEVRCPRCRNMMDRRGIEGGNGIPQDSCKKCELMWCDPGELEIHLLAWSNSAKGKEAIQFKKIHESMSGHEKEVLENRIKSLCLGHPSE